MSIAAIILAAGASRRLGRPKQTLEINGETLLARAIRIAREAELAPIFAVVATPELQQLAQSAAAIPLLNPNASEGIASSIRTGIAEAKRLAASAAVLMTCDQVALSPTHLRALCAGPGTITASSYAGTIGIPACFPASTFDALLQLQGDRGARSLLQNARTIPTESLRLDVDTEDDFLRARKLLEPQGIANRSGHSL